MTIITLDAIQAEHTRIGEMIAQFKAQEKQPAFFEFQGQRHDLADGEIYVATIITGGDYGSYHLILLPGQIDDANWDDAMRWAGEQGGQLPNRVESALLFKTHKAEFEEEAYWTREEGSDSSWAWGQGFTGGTQGYSLKTFGRRARAVRRLVIE